jgi:hypothetical protein
LTTDFLEVIYGLLSPLGDVSYQKASDKQEPPYIVFELSSSSESERDDLSLDYILDIRAYDKDASALEDTIDSINDAIDRIIHIDTNVYFRPIRLSKVQLPFENLTYGKEISFLVENLLRG